MMNGRAPEIPPHRLVSALRGLNLLPAIVFMPTRRKCDESASEVAADRSQKTDPDRQARRQALFDTYVVDNPEIRNHKHRKILVNAGVASHHAGHIPAWKLLVEKMMSAGLLNAIFATSTVAAGVDFPARTVVISNADTRGNDGWRPLSVNELQQMTGRAGRRGKDNVGFVILAPGQFQNPRKIAELLKTKPDPLESRFRATYTSLLNLLDAFGDFEHLREIAEKSFAFRDTRRKVEKMEREANDLEENLNIALGGNEFGFTVDDLRGFERLTAASTRLNESLPATRAELRHNWLRDNVIAGRLVSQGRSGKRFFIVLNVSGEKVSAMRDDGHGASFPLSRVNRVYEKVYGLRGDDLDEAFMETIEGSNPPLAEPKLKFKAAGTDDAAQLLNSSVERIFPADISGEQKQAAYQFLWQNREAVERIERTKRDVRILRSDIWLPFERRAMVLDHFGYVDFPAEKVTPTGKWLADVRVDRPLLVGEALRHGIFEGLEHRHLAGLMASLAADSERNYGELYLSDPLVDILAEFEDIIYEVSKIEWKFGIEPAEEINFSAAAAAERWADGMEWNDLVARTKAEEGDLVRLLSRTGEALLQVANLRDSNPEAAQRAFETADIMLREPIR